MGSSLILAAHFPPSVTFGAFSRFLDSSFPFFGGVDTDGDNSNNKKKAREKQQNKRSRSEAKFGALLLWAVVLLFYFDITLFSFLVAVLHGWSVRWSRRRPEAYLLFYFLVVSDGDATAFYYSR